MNLSPAVYLADPSRSSTHRYGISGPTLERQVVATGGHDSARVELYPPTFHFVKLVQESTDPSSESSPDAAPSESLSSGASVAELEKLAASSLQFTRPIRLWRVTSAEPVSAHNSGEF